MRKAIFGGSFNPIHNDHIALAESLAEKYSLDKVIIVPTYTTPLKDNSDIIDSSHRLNMCVLAAEDHPLFSVSEIEILRKGMSYTCDTISELKGDDELYLIVGADMFITLDSWRRFDYIAENAVILTVARGDINEQELLEKYEQLKPYGLKAYIEREAVGSVSSTMVRNRIRLGLDVSDMIDQKVYEYINRNNLYR